MRKNNELGRTMIEVLAVLSILGMLSGTILAAISRMHDKYKLSKITGQIVELQKKMNTRFAVEGSYGNLNISDLIKEGTIIPNDMIGNDDNLHHAYKQKVTIEPADAGGYNGQNKAFKITFEGLPFHVCTELLIIDWQIDNSSDLVQIEVNGTPHRWNEGKAVNTNTQLPTMLPIGLERAGEVCRTDNPNIIKWTFY